MTLPLGYPMAEVPGMMKEDERQYAPATLRNRDLIFDVLRDVLSMTGVILEIAAAQARISSISRIFRLSFSNLPRRRRSISVRGFQQPRATKFDRGLRS
jgi:hypothetical protein